MSNITCECRKPHFSNAPNLYQGDLLKFDFCIFIFDMFIYFVDASLENLQESEIPVTTRSLFIFPKKLYSRRIK